MTQCLTTIKPLQKPDVTTLLDVFGNLRGVCAAGVDELVLCPGLGDKKVKALHSVLHTPFLVDKDKNIGKRSAKDDKEAEDPAIDRVNDGKRPKISHREESELIGFKDAADLHKPDPKDFDIAKPSSTSKSNSTEVVDLLDDEDDDDR